MSPRRKTSTPKKRGKPSMPQTLKRWTAARSDSQLPPFNWGCLGAHTQFSGRDLQTLVATPAPENYNFPISSSTASYPGRP